VGRIGIVAAAVIPDRRFTATDSPVIGWPRFAARP
jgi:hypothetical protein